MTARPGTRLRDFGPSRWLDARFVWLCAAASIAYLLLELAYIQRLPLVMDEFAGAYQIHQLREGVPYRDYMPYKTVLGYALQLPWLALSSDPFTAMLLVKAGMAMFVAVTVFMVAINLRALFAPQAVLVGILLLFCHSTFLERSASLRVDMLTALFGLVSLLSLLLRRFELAAVIAGTSLLISQKGAYYVLPLAICMVLRFVWLDRSRQGFRQLLRAGAFCAAPLGTYWCGFGLFAGFGAVFGRVAVSPKAIAFTPLYDVGDYWWQTVFRNPWFYGAALASAIVVAWGCGRARRSLSNVETSVPRSVGEQPWSRCVLLIYTLVVSALCAWHKQPWPYFFVLLLPTLAVLIVAGADRVLAWRLPLSSRVGRVLYAFIAVLVLSLGCAWPLGRVPRVIERDSTFQRRTLAAAYALLGDAGSYFAGTQLLYDRRHVGASSWLDKRRLAQIAADPELLLGPLVADPPRLLIYTYRLRALPEAVRSWLDTRYVNVAGNLFSRSLRLGPGQSRVEIPYDSDYKVIAGELSTEGRVYGTGEVLRLSAGQISVLSDRGAQLVVWSQLPAFQRYLGLEPQAFFYNVYRY